MAGAVELSNTDIGGNLIDLILASTMYRGNTRVITTVQQMLDELDCGADDASSLETEGADAVIKLTRLGGEPFILNADLIQYVEARPDTFITLTTGERLVVAESMDEVLRRAVAYQQAKHLIPRPAP